jgi:hypothetical protein
METKVASARLPHWPSRATSWMAEFVVVAGERPGLPPVAVM